MGTLYSGVAASLATGVQITVPADGDTDNAATFDVGLQKLADYVEAIRAQYASTTAAIFGILCFGGTAPNAASTSSVFWNSGAQLVTGNTIQTSTASNFDQWGIMMPAPAVIRKIGIWHNITTSGGTINIVAYKVTANNITTAISTTSIPTGELALTFTPVTVNIALAAGDRLQFRHETQAGVTGGGGVWQISAQITTA